MSRGPRLVILGKQGAGKGTQCTRLARHYVIPHISTGDIFRASQRSETEAGRAIKAFLATGELVPDDVVVNVVRERLELDDTRGRGFILDGFPRTIPQAEALSKLLLPDDVDLALDLSIPTELAVERLGGRTICNVCATIYGPASPTRMEGICDVCGGEVVQRADDTEGAIRRRLALYEELTSPIINWYRDRGLLVEVDGTGDTDAVTARLVQEIDRKLGASKMRAEQ